MYHYIYKTISTSGKYYIGRHSTDNLDDGYLGSGLWVRSMKDKSSLRKEILSFCDSVEELLEKEKQLISENIGNQLCMNFNNEPIGFSSGDKNPSKMESRRKQMSERMSGENNPSKNKDVALKISNSLKGKPSKLKGKKLSEEDRKRISDSRLGLKYSEEGKKKLSESRKRDYYKGKRGVPSFSGLNHSQETLEKMKNSAMNREKRPCKHCGKVCAVNILSRFHDDKCKLKYEDLAI